MLLMRMPNLLSWTFTSSYGRVGSRPGAGSVFFCQVAPGPWRLPVFSLGWGTCQLLEHTEPPGSIADCPWGVGDCMQARCPQEMGLSTVPLPLTGAWSECPLPGPEGSVPIPPSPASPPAAPGQIVRPPASVGEWGLCPTGWSGRGAFNSFGPRSVASGHLGSSCQWQGRHPVSGQQ